ncbi:MAG: flagellar hook-basal body complex protein [Lachnospiraceae bacterium]
MRLAGTWNDQFSDITVHFSACKMDNNNKQSTITSRVHPARIQPEKKKTGCSDRTFGRYIGKKIWGTYDNGNTELLCQIASAQFANASGLEKVGENCYTTTLNSGDFDGIGTEITADGSKMTSGQLEMSNVDLSTEFTDMITTQRGFQANSRIITTSDTLLEEL